jgi:Fe-S-cluster-containing dehydrogenase component
MSHGCIHIWCSMMKRIFVIEDLCKGCKLCQMACSFINFNEFNPTKARIAIVKDSDQYIPIIDCNGSGCRAKRKGDLPKCVEVCNTGALIFCELEEAAKKRRELLRKRSKQPIFKVIAPWKWPYPWKPLKSV